MKQRLVGAGVLLSAAVVFLPMLIDSPRQREEIVAGAGIPDMPGEFESSITPLEVGLPDEPAMTPLRMHPDAPLPADGMPASSPDAKEATEIATSSAGDEGGLQPWLIQAGSFNSQDKATSLRNRLRKQFKGSKVVVEPAESQDRTVYRVLIGPELGRERVSKMADELARRYGVKPLIKRFRGAG